MFTAGTSIAMATERGRTATRDRSEHLLMLSVDPPSAAVDETLSCVANDVSHLQRRPAYTLRIASPDVANCSISSGLEVALRCLLERCR